ncbi:hypothetical protein Aca07nite_88280 [Actinoplanes capillaceus]|uniref:Peptidase inhibitor family I36 n=1 Tax=Actinoplanes campanulatus TaxID=113559 RepID=A0ABQ3WZ39_9ACTN|nr:hypothetical protein [Actinoplanes capillaceus]GID51553.1 hypothetical protein Aca07nite_88280 [Actinoplanes capillaceus]
MEELALFRRIVSTVTIFILVAFIHPAKVHAIGLDPVDHAGYVIDLNTGARVSVEEFAARVEVPCSPGYWCIYDSSSTADRLYSGRADSIPYSCQNLEGGTFDRKISYIWNNSVEDWNVYLSGGCTGTSGYIYPNSRGAMTGIYNNSIRSYKKLPTR